MKPLNNIKVLIPRPIDRTDEMAEKLKKLGATPILFPLIKVEAINQEELKTAHQNNTFDWIIFTSGIAVQIFFETIEPSEVKSKIAVVGTATKKTIEQLGLKVDFIPSAATAKKIDEANPFKQRRKSVNPSVKNCR